MKTICIGGGPSGLYLGILLKRANPAHEVVVCERNRANDTFGFGVVFSDATLENLAAADPASYAAICRSFAHWDNIDIHFGGERWRSKGHGFCGLSRVELLVILQRRCRELGVKLQFETEIRDIEALRGECDLLVGADGLGSSVRETYAESFAASVEVRPNRFVWLGTTFPFEAFTFHFKENADGLWRVHAYRYSDEGSTFIVECTAETFARTGLADDDEAATIEYVASLFRDELAGHPLIANRSIWRQFPTVRSGRWHHENVVLVGDAAHTAHFSIGSGTKLAMEDVIALEGALSSESSVTAALTSYERDRRPVVEATQRAAEVSLEWFESTERYRQLPPIQFAYSLLTRSLRVTHENLRRRDPQFVTAVETWFAGEESKPPPPMFTPFSLGPLELSNRVVAVSAPRGAAERGCVGDAHVVHGGARALSGAAMVLAGDAAISPEGRWGEKAAGLYGDEQIDPWRRVTAAIAAAGSRSLVRLAHAGPRAPGGGVAASALAFGEGALPRALGEAEMAGLEEDYLEAARRAEAAGFDALEVDFAGGGLLASFLSPLANLRSDAWGGALKCRAALPLRIAKALRARWKGPLLVRINACDWFPGGTDANDAVALARLLRAEAVDLVSVTTGGTVSGAKPPATERLFQATFSDRVRQEAGVMTMTGGGIASWDDINSLLAAGRADLCSLGRALAVDPGIVRAAAAAAGVVLPLPATYDFARGFAIRGLSR